MKKQLLAGLLLSFALLAPARAQVAPKVQFDNIQVGFSGAAEPGEVIDPRIGAALHKAGIWTPVYVSITAGPDGIQTGKVIIEATDNDDVQNHYTVPFPRGGLPEKEPFTFLTYTKASSLHGKITVTVEADGKRFEKEHTYESLIPGDVLYLTVGSRLSGLRRALTPQNAESTAIAQTRFAYVDRDVQALPDHWFGYSPVDLLILTTGNRDFTSLLLNERENRKEALAEWVRRGGRLVLSFGRNQDMVPELLQRLQMDLPVVLRGPMALPNLHAVQGWLPGTPPLENAAPRRQPGQRPPPVEVARMERKPQGELEMIVPERKTDESPLLIARAPYGLGQVILVAFDLDGPPFTSWGGEAEFWKKFQEKTRTKPSEIAVTTAYRPNAMEQNDDLAATLERELENFQDIPVISFGWVALFILIYILVVGPLDYFFLKKVVKRLELTWITFPTIVLIVSAAAYYAAYSLKGNDLRINKVDLVDLDFQTNRIYGNTWFTLFSPRIQLYTVGVEPGFVPESAGRNTTNQSLVSWMGRPDTSYGGYNRPRSQSLFRRTYDYAPEAAGMQGVPIQVWSTKSFSASWERPFDAARAPLQANLRRLASQQGIEGSITSRLAAPLEDAVLIYGEGRADAKVYSLGTLFPGTPKRLNASTPATSIQQWVTQAYGSGAAGSATSGAAAQALAGGLMKRVMFYGVSAQFSGAAQQATHNTVLQYLDQSWRRSHTNEAILVGRMAPVEGPAGTMNEAAEAPSRLWLGQLPDSGESRPDIAGTLAQSTYVRGFLPVLPTAMQQEQRDRSHD
jgi:hypothetical protein